jgi:hypothetical protein
MAKGPSEMAIIGPKPQNGWLDTNQLKSPTSALLKPQKQPFLKRLMLAKPAQQALMTTFQNREVITCLTIKECGSPRHIEHFLPDSTGSAPNEG